ncbi:MAG: BadF/BadG/BcrA/BcrD ATPase family protein [Patescibacteria group bacterium]
MDFVIGIDGGGSKSRVAVADLSGKILAQSEGGPTNLHTIPLTKIIENVKKATWQTMQAVPVKGDPRAICFGTAGLDAPKDKVTADGIISELFPNVPKKISVNDTVIAWRSNSDLEFGFALISGTGSNSFGLNQAGKSAFVGGLGDVLSDEGSAFAVGQAALRAAVRDEDGRAPSKLRPLVLEALGMPSMRESVPFIYDSDFGKQDIAALAPLVDKAVEQGDKVARHILEKAGDDLALMICTLARRLEMEDTECDLVLIGSQINNSEIIFNRFAETIRSTLPKVRIKKAEQPAVVGAVRLAIDQLK